jgi:hypothetical protein
VSTYDASLDPVHGSGWNSAARWGGWDWRKPSRGEHFRTCSFCGSINPEDLAAETAGSGCGYPDCPDPRNELANIHFPICGRDGDPPGSHRFVNTGWRASWADRKYGWPHKFYVEGLVNRDPDRLYVFSSTNSAEAPEAYGQPWVSARKLTRRQRAAVKEYRGGRDSTSTWYQFGAHETHHAKFYTIHLADKQLPDGVKDTIERVCGLAFTFTDDGRAGWQPVSA